MGQMGSAGGQRPLDKDRVVLIGNADWGGNAMGSHVSGISAFFPALAEPQSLRRDEQAGEAAF